MPPIVQVKIQKRGFIIQITNEETHMAAQIPASGGLDHVTRGAEMLAEVIGGTFKRDAPSDAREVTPIAPTAAKPDPRLN